MTRSHVGRSLAPSLARFELWSPVHYMESMGYFLNWILCHWGMLLLNPVFNIFSHFDRQSHNVSWKKKTKTLLGPFSIEAVPGLVLGQRLMWDQFFLFQQTQNCPLVKKWWFQSGTRSLLTQKDRTVMSGVGGGATVTKQSQQHTAIKKKCPIFLEEV